MILLTLDVASSLKASYQLDTRMCQRGSVLLKLSLKPEQIPIHQLGSQRQTLHSARSHQLITRRSGDFVSVVVDHAPQASICLQWDKEPLTPNMLAMVSDISSSTDHPGVPFSLWRAPEAEQEAHSDILRI